jgi:hypothetical protein
MFREWSSPDAMSIVEKDDLIVMTFLIDSDRVVLNLSSSFVLALYLSYHLVMSSLNLLISSSSCSSFCSLFSMSFFSLLISLTALTFYYLIMLVIFSVLLLSAWRLLISLSRVL